MYVRREGSSQAEQWKGRYFGTTNSTFDLSGPWKPTVSTQDGFGIGRGTEVTDPLVARNLRTGALHWQNSVVGNAVIALDGGGGAVRDDLGGFRSIEADGSMGAIENVGVGPGPFAFGRLHVRDANQSLQSVPWKPLDDATAFFDQGTGAMVATPLQYGVFAKGHTVVFDSTKHVSIRLVPRNQQRWREDSVWGSFFLKTEKVMGDLYYATLGAGPVPDGTCPNTTSLLGAAINRPADRLAKQEHLQQLPLWPRLEDDRISTMLAKTFNFQTNLDYDCVPLALFGGYNSNSWARGLLEVSDVPLPSFPLLTTYYGWSKPVPPAHFPN